MKNMQCLKTDKWLTIVVDNNLCNCDDDTVQLWYAET